MVVVGVVVVVDVLIVGFGKVLVVYFVEFLNFVEVEMNFVVSYFVVVVVVVIVEVSKGM